VLITADDSPDIDVEATAAGVPLLRKPFRFEELLSAVESGQSVCHA
jgi:DNA-binding response OmpR family regulator